MTTSPRDDYVPLLPNQGREEGPFAVHPTVIRSLMQLQKVDLLTVSKLIHVPHSLLLSWLSETLPDADELVPLPTQMELLALLGLRGSAPHTAPRSDVVHYWHIHESLFSRAESTYAPLRVVLKAFGPAQVAYVARQNDPLLSLSATAHFALTFATFVAILEVTAHPLRTISFDPGSMTELSWFPGVQGLMLTDEEYLRLEPGSLQVRGLQSYLAHSAEATQWDHLRTSAQAQGISADQVATLLLGPAASAPLQEKPPRQVQLRAVPAVAPPPAATRPVPVTAPLAASSTQAAAMRQPFGPAPTPPVRTTPARTIRRERPVSAGIKSREKFQPGR